jgi:hypothetical protein
VLLSAAHSSLPAGDALVVAISRENQNGRAIPAFGGDPESVITKLLKWDGAELIAHNRHLKYRLSNGALFIRSISGSSWGVRNSLADLKRLLRTGKQEAA